MMRFQCPTCQKKLKAPDDAVGQKTSCPRCGQRLQVPPPFQARDKTVLGEPMPDAAALPSEGVFPAHSVSGPDWLKDVASQPADPSVPASYVPPLDTPAPGQVFVVCPKCGRRISLQPHEMFLTITCARCDANFRPGSPQPAPAGGADTGRVAGSAPDVVEVIGEAPPSQHQNCLECGADMTGQSRVQMCPHCACLLCSARCYREHDYHAHGGGHKARDRVSQCPFCGTTARPYVSSAISQAGWITFVLLLLFCLPLFWIGLLITEPQVHCSECGARFR
jgi:hypothetical protein